jgi:glycine hydroxymethyltransferase
MDNDFFQRGLQAADPEVQEAIAGELKRQRYNIELIASENIVSRAVLEAQGSIMTNKYVEGYPGKRYYGGCEFVDVAETIAIERAKKLYGVNFANVQPHSGSQANQAVFLALLQPGDSILGLSLDAGGHLTHGASVNQSGKWFNAHHYGVHKEDGLIDYDMVEQLAQKHQPKLIIAGVSAYPRAIDFARFRAIADQVGAYLLVDMAHFSGLVAAKVYPSNPFDYADVVTTTTHKTLRGPRGGMILSNDEEIATKLNRAVFPGLQGGTLPHVIAAKAVAFGEALKPEFKTYAQQVVKNAQTLAETMVNRGYKVVTGGTDTHLLLIDLRPQGLTGKAASNSMEAAGLTCNKNSVPFDEASPFVTSGIRLGTPACTTRGFKEQEFKKVGNLICDVLDSLIGNDGNNTACEKKVFEQVKDLCDKFPIY